MSNYQKLSQERKELQKQGLVPEWMTTAGYQLFKEKYQWAESYRHQLEVIAATLARHTNDVRFFTDKFFEVMWKGWLSPSTPILANCGTDRGLVVSCAGQYVEDSIDGFYSARREAALLTKYGFGTSAYLGDVRSRGTPISSGGRASGILPVLKGFIQDSREVSQGGVRRGSFAGYIPIEHGDFHEIVAYLEKEPDDLNVGWNVSDKFIEELKSREEEARQRFARSLKAKMITGKGYFWFIDKARKALPEVYKRDGLQHHASNLCSEILLPSDKNHTYTCVLASLNLAKWDEWKDTYAVAVATKFLDCVCSEFIEKGRNLPGLENAIRFTEKYRALGLGVMGFHTYLQDHMIPFGSLEAHMWNIEVFKYIQQEAKEQSCGRNASLIAIAPTKSTALLMGGVSEGINPDPAMTFTQSTAGGEMDRINPALLKLMKSRDIFNKSTVQDIIDKFGSVQHVDWLDDNEKSVFKTAFEINQDDVLRLASARAPYIDQWQSLNLFIGAGTEPKRVAEIHRKAFEDPNILGLYYVYSSTNIAASKDDCEACAS